MKCHIIFIVSSLFLTVVINQTIKIDKGFFKLNSPYSSLTNLTNGSQFTIKMDGNFSSSKYCDIYLSINSIGYAIYSSMYEQYFNVSLNYSKGTLQFKVTFAFTVNFNFNFVGIHYIIAYQNSQHTFITFPYSLQTSNTSQLSGTVDYVGIVGQNLPKNSYLKLVYSILGIKFGSITQGSRIGQQLMYISGSQIYFNATGINSSQIKIVWLSVVVIQVTVVANQQIYFLDIYSLQITVGYTLRIYEPYQISTFFSGLSQYQPSSYFSFSYSSVSTNQINSSYKYQEWKPQNYDPNLDVNIGFGVIASGQFGCQEFVSQNFNSNCTNTCISNISSNTSFLLNNISLDWKIKCQVCFTARICTKVYCGNGHIEENQKCDSGFDNGKNDSGCTINCTPQIGYNCIIINSISSCNPVCGDEIVVGVEDCDLGNLNGEPGQGCSSSCTIIKGYYCNLTVNDSSYCYNVCGDAIVAGNQKCDFGPYDPNKITGCSVNCTDLPGYYCFPPVNSTAECNTSCGDSYVAGLEECDMGTENGKSKGCSSSCTQQIGFICKINQQQTSDCNSDCGDGLAVGNEQCDNGKNGSVGDGCTVKCTAVLGYHCSISNYTSLCVSLCGDGLTVIGKQECDFANQSILNGCSSNCTILDGFYCNISEDALSSCQTICGDGIIAGSQECDEGSLNGKQYKPCSSNCTILPGYYCSFSNNASSCITICGDSFVAGQEECDTLNNSQNNGCYVNCTIPPGYYCQSINYTSQCSNNCGDNITVGSQQCDLGIQNGLDSACSSNCSINQGYNCTINTILTQCWPVCGDGITVQGQQCDNGQLNLSSDDGCSQNCTIQPGYHCTIVNKTSTCSLDNSNTICLQESLTQPCNSLSLPSQPLSYTSFLKVTDQNAIKISLQSRTPMITVSRRLLIQVDPNAQYLLPAQIKLNFPYESATMSIPNPYQMKLTVYYNVSLNDITDFRVAINSYETQLPEVTDNNLALKLYPASQYSKAAFFLKFISILVYIAFCFTILIFFFSSQLIALQLQFLFQFIYGCLITLRKMEPSIMPFTSLWIFNGYFYPINDETDVPPRLKVLGYHADFISNFNINLIIFLLPLTIGFFTMLYQKIFKRRGKYAEKLAKKLLEEWQLTAIIFCLQPLLFAFIINLKFSNSMGLGIGIGLLLFGIIGVYIYKFYEKNTEKSHTRQQFGDFKKFFRNGRLNFYLIIIALRICLNLAMLLGFQTIVSHGIILSILSLWVVLTIWKRPYQKRHQLIPIVNSFVLLLITIFFLYSRYQSDHTEINFATYIPIGVLIVLGAMFLANLLYSIVHIHQLVKLNRHKQQFQITVHKEATSQIFEGKQIGSEMITEMHEINTQHIDKIFQTTMHQRDEQSSISTKGHQPRQSRVLSSIPQGQDDQSGNYLQNNSPIKNLILPNISGILAPTVVSGFNSVTKQ